MSLKDKIKNAKKTPWLSYYRPKKKLAYKFGSFLDTSTIITCHPRNKWLCLGVDNELVQLNNKNVYMYIPIKEFEEMWEECL